MKISSSVFPEGIAGAIANPASLGTLTNTIFSYPSSILRILGGYGMLNVVHQSTQPATPIEGMVWITPATLVAGSIVESDVKIYNSGAFVDPTKTLWEKFIGGSSTVDAATIASMLNDVITNPSSTVNQELTANLLNIIESQTTNLLKSTDDFDGGEL